MPTTYYTLHRIHILRYSSIISRLRQIGYDLLGLCRFFLKELFPPIGRQNYLITPRSDFQERVSQFNISEDVAANEVRSHELIQHSKLAKYLRQFSNGRAGTRTLDQRLKRPLLYQLSYPAWVVVHFTGSGTGRRTRAVAACPRPVRTRVRTT